MLATVDFRLQLLGGDQRLPMVYPRCLAQDVNHVTRKDTINRVRATTSQDRINISFEGRKVRACDEQLSRELFSLADAAYGVFQLAQADYLKGVTSWTNSNGESKDNFASYLLYLDAKDRLKEVNDPRRKYARRQCDFDLDDLPTKP